MTVIKPEIAIIIKENRWGKYKLSRFKYNLSQLCHLIVFNFIESNKFIINLVKLINEINKLIT